MSIPIHHINVRQEFRWDKLEGPINKINNVAILYRVVQMIDKEKWIAMSDPGNYSLDRSQKEFLKNETFHGNEIVSATFKTALMNRYLQTVVF